MGFNYKRCGYSSAQKMYDDFATGEKAQLEGFNKFILYDPILLNACQNKNYYTMAYRYNGSGNADAYASKIEVAYTAYKNA